MTFTDERGIEVTSLAIVGDSKVHMLDGRSVGLTKRATPVGLASDWLRKGVFALLGRKTK